MKRLCLFYLFFQFAQPAYSDWELFPLNQKSYYQFADISQTDQRINCIAFDTVVQRSGYQSAYQNRKYSGNGIEACYAEVTDLNNYLPGSGWMEMEFDSLVLSGDTVRYSPKIYFLPNVSVGESWRTSGNLSNGITDIEFTCTSITLQSFLGITDSVKEFTLSTYYGTNLVSSSLTGYVIKLSKNYGLIDYLGFYYLHINYVEEHRLIGVKDSSGTFGFQAPNYLDFFPYKVGDVLNWKSEAVPIWSPSVYHFSQVTITSVNITPDSLKYSGIRKSYSTTSGIYHYDTAEVFFPVKYFKSITECPTNWIVLNSDNNYSSSGLSLTSSFDFEQDSSITYRIVEDGYIIDTSNCLLNQIPDATEHDIYNTKQGHTEYCYDAFYYNCVKLIGSYMDGVLYGDTNFVTRIENISVLDLINVVPNPAKESFFLEVKNPVGTYTLISAQGLVCKQAKVSQLKTEINIEALSKGIYFIKYIDENNTQSVKRIIRM